MVNNEIQFLLYTMPEEKGTVQVVVKDEMLWCTQKAMAQLFVVGVPVISKHLSHIFDDGELDYAECSFDYDNKSPTTKEFFQMVQNRFHYAITGQTAPEIIYTLFGIRESHPTSGIYIVKDRWKCRKILNAK